MAGRLCGISVSHSVVDKVVGYIARQPEHHRTISLQDELRSMLNEQKLEFDERYVWD